MDHLGSRRADPLDLEIEMLSSQYESSTDHRGGHRGDPRGRDRDGRYQDRRGHAEARHRSREPRARGPDHNQRAPSKPPAVVEDFSPLAVVSGLLGGGRPEPPGQTSSWITSSLVGLDRGARTSPDDVEVPPPPPLPSAPPLQHTVPSSRFAPGGQARVPDGDLQLPARTPRPQCPERLVVLWQGPRAGRRRHSSVEDDTAPWRAR